MGSGLLYIVMTGCPDKGCLKKVMEPILRKLGPASFDCVDSKMAWSSKRPVWFQSIVDLLEPYFIPILGIYVSAAEPTLFIRNICFTEEILMEVCGKLNICPSKLFPKYFVSRDNNAI